MLVLRGDPIFVTAVHHALPPGHIAEIPTDGTTQSLGERHGRLEAQLALDLAAVDRVSPVVSGAVGYKIDEGRGFLAFQHRASWKTRVQVGACRNLTIGTL